MRKRRETLHSPVETLESQGAHSGLMGPDRRSSVGRGGVAIVDGHTSLATVEAILWPWLKRREQPRGLEPRKCIWADCARRSFKEELIHSSGTRFRNFRGSRIENRGSRFEIRRRCSLLVARCSSGRAGPLLLLLPIAWRLVSSKRGVVIRNES